jgi:hypothetical protein
MLLSAVSHSNGLVFSLISLVTLIVFVCVFEHGKAEHYSERGQHSWLTIGNRYCLEALHDCNDYEVHVWSFSELYSEKVHGYEGEKRIFVGRYCIVFPVVLYFLAILYCELFTFGMPHLF